MTYNPAPWSEHQGDPFTSSRGKHRISEEDARAEIDKEEEGNDKDEKKMRGLCCSKDAELYPDEENGNEDTYCHEGEETTSHTLGRSEASSHTLGISEGSVNSETSSHTLGRSDVSSCTFGRSSGAESEDGGCGSDESEEEGDLFKKSCEEGSR